MATKRKPKETAAPAPYKHIAALGVKVYSSESYDYVLNSELDTGLKTEERRKRFSHFFGSQTCPLIGNEKDGYKQGLYPWDVEAVLERMETGKRVGTQSVAGWD